MLAHAVDHDAAFFVRAADDPAPGAHAESVYAALARFIREAVFRRAQARMPRVLPELGAVDERARMLYAHAHRVRLGGELKPRRVQHAVGVIRVLPDGEQQRREGEPFFARGRLHARSYKRAVPALEACELRVEANLAAEALDLHADGGNHAAELVRTDVGLGVDNGFLRRAEAREDAKRLVAKRVLDARGELAIRKCARAALAEHNVALRVERPARPETFDIPLPLGNLPAALKHDGAVAGACELIRRKKACRAEPGDDDRRGERRFTQARLEGRARRRGLCPA